MDLNMAFCFCSGKCKGKKRAFQRAFVKLDISLLLISLVKWGICCRESARICQRLALLPVAGLPPVTMAPRSLQSSFFCRSFLVTWKQNKRKHSLPVATASPHGWPDIFAWEHCSHLQNTLEFTAWGLGSACCGFSPQKSSFPNSVTQPKCSVSFPGFASHCPFETRPVIQPSRGWAGLLLESFTRGSLSKKNACSASASQHLLLYLHCLPDIKKQQRGFKKEIPHLQLSLSSSFPASVSIITTVWNKQNQTKTKRQTISYSLFSNRKTGYWVRLHLWRRETLR